MANFTLPKINLGSEKKPLKSMDLTHDVSTTADFCFPQPIMCQEMIPGSKGVLVNAQMVRLAPLVAPSYGVVTYNTYYRFVPIAELLPSFESMLAGKPYYTASSNYIPAGVPQVAVSRLTAWLLTNYTTFTTYKKQGNPGSDGTTVYKIMSYSAGDTDLPTAISAFNTGFGLGVASNQLNIANYATNMAATYYDTIPRVELSGADYIVKVSDYIFAFRFSQEGLHLRKIMLGLGYQLDIENANPVSVLPLCAYYKAWYDIFAPKQTTVWESTACYKFLDYMRENGSTNLIVPSTSSGASNLFVAFFNSLVDCWYTSNPDFVSGHIANNAINDTAAVVPYNQSNALAMRTDVTVSQNNAPTLTQVSTNNGITRVRMQLLNKLSTWVNKNSIIGGRIDKYMRTHFGADYIDSVDSYRIGEDVVLCEIDPVISQAQTTEKTLGSYAGMGVGQSNGKKLTFSADTFGYWIGLGVVVPASSGYAQGVDPKLYHLDRFTFYNPQFDAVGFEITSKDQIFGANDVALNGTSTTPASFGFIPRYSGCKVAQNVINGNISLRSTRTDYLPYTLDRYISPGELISSPVMQNGVPSTTDFKVSTYAPVLPIANEEYRYLGKYSFMGNFDRVFQNEGYDAVLNPNLFKYLPMEDNFIIHNFMQFEYIAPMIPLSDSFDTDAENNNDVSIEKA